MMPTCPACPCLPEDFQWLLSAPDGSGAYRGGILQPQLPLHSMILAKGEKIHIIHRKILEHEPHRHFIGIVDACDHGVARVTGHIYTVDRQKGEWVRRNEVRTRIVSLTAGSLIINVLPSGVNLDKIAYVQENKAIRVTDGSSWHLDISEVTWL